jgi:hypothetical protein
LGTAIDNNYIKVITPSNTTAFKNITNAFINTQPTYVASAMLKPDNTFLANKKMDYKYYMAMTNTRAGSLLPRTIPANPHIPKKHKEAES